MATIDRAAESELDALKRTLFEAFSDASVADFGVEGVLPPGVEDGSMVDRALDEQTMYAIRADGEVVGGIIVEERPANEMFLQTLWVDPAHQRRSIGSEAMAFLKSTYADADAWTLETPKASERNRRFYERHGFEIVDEQGVPGEEVVLLTYRKDLE